MLIKLIAIIVVSLGSSVMFSYWLVFEMFKIKNKLYKFLFVVFTAIIHFMFFVFSITSINTLPLFVCILLLSIYYASFFMLLIFGVRSPITNILHFLSIKSKDKKGDNKNE
jgi:pilus assembly protein TadC